MIKVEKLTESSNEVIIKLSCENDIVLNNFMYSIYDKLAIINSLKDDKYISPQRIFRIVCDYFHERPEDVLRLNNKGKLNRSRGLVKIRHISCFFFRKFCIESLKTCERTFGASFDHANILTAANKISNYLTYDKTLANEINNIKAILTMKNL